MILCKQKILLGILGPTATGKTSLSIQLAKELKKVEIISVDSRQVYRYMDIGTAKPTLAEQTQIKHHFIDIKDPDESYSAGDFGRQARALLQEMWTRGITPLLVGGSGLYLQAVLDGFFPDTSADGPIRIEVQKQLAGQGVAALYEELGRLDPSSQARTGSQDVRRIARALEIAYAQKLVNAPLAKVHSHSLDCLPLLFCLHRDRQILYQRIAQRVDQMLAGGLVAEVDGLRQRGYGRACRAMRTLGYAEILDFLENCRSLEEATALIKKRSQQYAKRQLTWFRSDRRLRWLDLDCWGERGVRQRIMAQFRLEEEGSNAFAIDSGS